jgi:dynein heavy chain 1
MLVQDDGTTSGASTVVTTPSAQATPYDGLHSLVHWGVAPWFDSYVSSKQGVNEVVTAKKGNEAQMGELARTDMG